MKTIKNYLISVGISLLLVLLFAFILNVLNYFDVLNKSFYKVFLILFSVISIFVGSYSTGYNSNKKGYLNGFVFGIFISLIFIILSLLFKADLSVSSFIYYLIIVITSLVGGAVGINKKTAEVAQ